MPIRLGMVKIKENQFKKAGTDNSIYELTSVPQVGFRPSQLALGSRQRHLEDMHGTDWFKAEASARGSPSAAAAADRITDREVVDG
jgi:hypothetical protein